MRTRTAMRAKVNQKPNKKSNRIAPQKHDRSANTASMLMLDPKYPKAFSEHLGDDPRIDEIKNYRSQNNKVISILDELATKQTEIVDRTPFDDYENNIAMKLIDQRITELYQLVLQNPEITKEYVENAVEPLRERVGPNSI